MSRLSELMRFGIVGTLGFLTDGGLLMLLTSGFGWPPIAARFISFPTALSVTWLANRHWTFSEGHQLSAGPQYLRYAAVQLGGAGLNFLVYAGLIAAHPVFLRCPVLALAIASVVAMFVNYGLSRRFAFSK